VRVTHPAKGSFDSPLIGIVRARIAELALCASLPEALMSLSTHRVPVGLTPETILQRLRERLSKLTVRWGLLVDRRVAQKCPVQHVCDQSWRWTRHLDHTHHKTMYGRTTELEIWVTRVAGFVVVVMMFQILEVEQL
jgi:hypothetical protein